MTKLPPSPFIENATILEHLKEAYLLWISILPHFPKEYRFTLGQRIENKFLDVLELTYTAYFTDRENKSAKIDECIYALDLLKFLIHLGWETKCIANNQYAELSEKLVEPGKMFGGWRKNLANPEKKNRNL